MGLLAGISSRTLLGLLTVGDSVAGFTTIVAIERGRAILPLLHGTASR